MNVEEIAGKFVTEGSIANVKDHGGGHINDSYRLVNTSLGHSDYLLQRVNHNVFKDVPLLMRNMVLVTDHVKTKVLKESPAEVGRRNLTIIPATDGKSYFKDPDGNFGGYCALSRTTWCSTAPPIRPSPMKEQRLLVHFLQC